jgi:hypothetical protein
MSPWRFAAFPALRGTMVAAASVAAGLAKSGSDVLAWICVVNDIWDANVLETVGYDCWKNGPGTMSEFTRRSVST